jgi:Zn-dependent protease with chaperone function
MQAAELGGYLTSTLAFREQAHRRATLLGIGALILLGTSPVFGHHLPLGIDVLLAEVDHFGTLCLAALHLLAAPVHRVFHIVIVAGLAYAAWDRLRAWQRVRRTLASLPARQVVAGDPFSAAAYSAGVDPRRLRVVAGLPSPAFTVGLLTPRIFLAEELRDRLTAGQLAAVVAHEGAHAARRDPLRLSLLRALACTLFWIPALRRLADDVADEAEVLADDVAARGDPLVLASAIVAVAEWPLARFDARLAESTVAFGRRDLLDRRVRRLVGEEVSLGTHVTRGSIAAAALALSVVWSTGLLMAHPLAAGASVSARAGSAPDAHHCDHRHESPLSHLFCLGSPFAVGTGECPHRTR